MPDASGDWQCATGARGASGPRSSGPVSNAQASDADSTSLERLAAVPASAALPESAQWKPAVNYDVISPAQPTTVEPGKVEVLEVFGSDAPTASRSSLTSATG